MPVRLKPECGLHSMGAKWIRIVMHSGVAAVVFFVMQRYVLNAGLESSLRWAISMAVFAAILSWQQSIR